MHSFLLKDSFISKATLLTGKAESCKEVTKKCYDKMAPVSKAQRLKKKLGNGLKNYKYSLSDRNKMFIFLMVKFCSVWNSHLIMKMYNNLDFPYIFTVKSTHAH